MTVSSKGNQIDGGGILAFKTKLCIWGQIEATVGSCLFPLLLPGAPSLARFRARLIFPLLETVKGSQIMNYRLGGTRLGGPIRQFSETCSIIGPDLVTSGTCSIIGHPLSGTCSIIGPPAPEPAPSSANPPPEPAPSSAHPPPEPAPSSAHPLPTPPSDLLCRSLRF